MKPRRTVDGLKDVRARRVSRRSPRALFALVAAAGAVAILRSQAKAAADYWTGGFSWRYGFWTNGIPAPGDDAFITQNDAANRTVSYDWNYSPTNALNSLTLDNTGSGTNTLAPATGGGIELSANTEYVGFNGQGAYIDGTSNNNTLYLYLGFNSSASGAYTLSNNASLSVSVGESVGGGGTAGGGAGIFNQTGGTHSVGEDRVGGGELDVGYKGGSGVYTLRNGSLLVRGVERIGYGGNGIVNQLAGTHSIDGELDIGYNNGSGTYTLMGGSLALGNFMYVGYGGNGVVGQSGGTVGPRLVIGYNGGAGTYNLSGGALNARLTEYVGSNGAGAFNQTGGTHTIGASGGGALYVGYNSGSGTYTQSGGSLNVSDERIGYGGTGMFVQSAGTHTVGTLTAGFGGGNGSITLSGGVQTAATLNVGAGTGSSGTFNLSGGALTVSENEYVGGSGSTNSGGTGIFNQTGGIHTVKGGGGFGEFDIGNNSSGTYNLSGGSLAIWNWLIVGGGGFTPQYGASSGVINQSGGILSIAGTQGHGWLSIGRDNGGSAGTYNLSGGTIVLAQALNVADGDGAVGTLNMSSGSITAQDLWVCRHDNSVGLLVQTGGTITVTGSDGAYIGGDFGGSPALTFSNALSTYQLLGGVLASSGTGVLHLNGNGTLFVGTNATISGFGPFNQNGGSATIAGTLTVDPSGSGAVTAYNFTGGIATIGSLAGANGSTTVGGGTGSALLSVSSFAQNNMTINSGGKVQVRDNPPHAVTNIATTLSIATNNALLDIDKEDLLIDNTATPFSSIHNNSNGIGASGTGMWDRGYNYQAANGFGVWDGTSGLTSSTARASAQADGRITLGCIDGAWQNDPNIGDLGIGLATNRILVRPALMGDVNLDGVVDANDIGQIIGLGYFGTGQAPHGWLDGDLNGDGVVDINDIGLIIGAGTFNNGSYGPAVAAAVQTPEPSALILLGIGAAGLLARRRRRRAV